MDQDEALDRLYAAPLDEFTETRNDLAKEVDDGAAAIRKLKKPSVAAWAVNQLAREESDAIAQLLDVHERMGAAANASELRGAAAERRDAVGGLVSSARKILERAGHNAAASTLEKISQTLLAASGSDERELVRTGRLTRELAGTGMDAFGLAPDLPDDDETSGPQVSMKVQREIERLRRDAERAEQEAAQAAQDANFAAEHARRTRTAAEEAERVAKELREKAEKAAKDAGL